MGRQGNGAPGGDGLREHAQAQRGHPAGGSPNLVQLHDLVGDHHEDQGEAAQEPRQQRHVLQAKVDVAVPVCPQLQVHCCLDHLPQQPAGGGSPASAGVSCFLPCFSQREQLKEGTLQPLAQSPPSNHSPAAAPPLLPPSIPERLTPRARSPPTRGLSRGSFSTGAWCDARG